MRPRSGRWSRTRHRARVDLPHPDSPTMPSVSPRSTVKLTLLRARTMRVGRRPMRSRMVGGRTKLMPRSSTVNSRAEATGRRRLANADVGLAQAAGMVVRADLAQRRAPGDARFDGERAARREGAADWQRRQRWRLARDRG